MYLQLKNKCWMDSSMLVVYRFILHACNLVKVLRFLALVLHNSMENLGAILDQIPILSGSKVPLGLSSLACGRVESSVVTEAGYTGVDSVLIGKNFFSHMGF